MFSGQVTCLWYKGGCWNSNSHPQSKGYIGGGHSIQGDLVVFSHELLICCHSELKITLFMRDILFCWEKCHQETFCFEGNATKRHFLLREMPSIDIFLWEISQLEIFSWEKSHRDREIFLLEKSHLQTFSCERNLIRKYFHVRETSSRIIYLWEKSHLEIFSCEKRLIEKWQSTK